jgi:hypothetical protein
MATQQGLSREVLASIPVTYFKAVDDMDVDAILSHFAEDAWMSVQTDGVVFEGHDAIRAMFTDFTNGSVSIFHEIKNIVIEPEARKIATEQSYIGELKTGAKNDMHNCNFFDINADGKIQRMIIWMAGTNPLGRV